MNLLPVIGCGLLGLGVVFLLVPLTLRFCGTPSRDRDFHHTHHNPVPRLGGLALVGAFISVEIFLALHFPAERSRVPGRSAVILGSIAMFALGFWDDLRPLGAKKKLLGQMLIALAVYYAGIGIERFKIPFTHYELALNGWGVLVTVLWLVGITNLINLIDGVDGLATGICLMLMGLLVYVGYQNGTFVFLTAGMTGALIGFLWFNFPPARIYLGDGGAYFLGFQIGLFSIVSSHKGSVFAALIAPLFVLALPIVDMGLAILRRGLRGLPLFRPDRRHIHHHLLGMGMSRRKVVLSLYSVTLVFLIMGFVAFWSRGQLVPVLIGLSVLILLLCAGQLSFSREWLAVGRTLGNSLAMRQEVQYALSLMNWLNHEGTRCQSLGDLYEDLVFAARRLGFSVVKVRLADGERTWQETVACRSPRVFRQELQGGLCGIIELQAPACLGVDCAHPSIKCPDAQLKPCPNTVDARLFDLMAELVAEGWSRAAGKSRVNGTPLSFSTPAWAGVAAGRNHRNLASAGHLNGTRNKTVGVGNDSICGTGVIG